MRFTGRPINELIALAANGGGFEVDAATRPLTELIAIASNAAGKARIVVVNAGLRPINDLIAIAANGEGSVFFKD